MYSFKNILTTPFFKCYTLTIVVLLLINTDPTVAQDVVFSEIMFAPTASNSEFIEVFNMSNFSVDLTNYSIKYSTASADKIISLDSNYILLPNQYGLVFEADYDFNTGVYNNIIHQDAKIFVLDDNAFGSSGMSNSSDRTVYLISSTEDTTDIYTYSANNSNGISDERVKYQEDVWMNSIVVNGTPGAKNSVAPSLYDLAITNFQGSASNVILNDSLNIILTVKNIGTAEANNFSISIYHGSEKEEIIYSNNFSQLNSGDSLTINTNRTIFLEGENIFSAQIDFPLDELLNNNVSSISVNGILINEIEGDIVINEFMYAPQNEQPEWIELFNRSEKEISLKNYRIMDNSGAEAIIDGSLNFLPDQFYVIADDSSILNFYSKIENLIVVNFPTLNNSGDDIVIKDSLNRIIDSVGYTSDWGGTNGNSIERISVEESSLNIDNWKESKFPTPGIINSVSQKNRDLKIDTVYTEQRRPIVNTTTKIVTEVENTGKLPLNYTISIYSDVDNDSLADVLVEQSNTLALNDGEKTIFYFTTELNIKPTDQYFIVKLEVEDDDTTDNKYYFAVKPSYPKYSILINEIMYSPLNFEPEWIELFNNSNYDINILSWSVEDILTNPVNRSVDEEYLFPADSYLIISKSKSIYDFHKSIKVPVLEVPFANLNNDEDGVVIKDFNGKTIDSVLYSSDWGGNGGKSLERINTNFESTNPNSWGSSIDIEGGTPGRINSITPKEYDLSVMSLNSIPPYPIKNEKINLTVKIFNYGMFDADNFKVQFYTYENHNEMIFETIDNLYLKSSDSLVVTSAKSVNLVDTIKVAVVIEYENDQDEVNNYTDRVIIPGFNKNTILINEIMFKPSENQPEWIEIVNNTDSAVNIKNWQVGDLNSRTILTSADVIVNPGELAVIIERNTNLNDDIFSIETNLPSFGNIKDAVIIYDYRNAVMDSVYYNVGSSFEEGRSLERIELESASTNQDNWIFSLSPDKSTPGKENSILTIPNYSFGQAVISEIMFDPEISNSEFIELFNNSNSEIELGGWKLKVGDDNPIYISDKSYILEPNQYFVVAADSSIVKQYNWLQENKNLSILNKSSLNLTNGGKPIYIIDIKNNIIDSIKYSDSWHNSALLLTKNISLELINPALIRNKGSNWSSCVSELGATPGIENSINTKLLSSKSKLEISPNPFSPDNDGHEDFTLISYNLTQPVSQIRVRVFDSKGRFVREIANNEPSGAKGAIVFDGLDENKKALRMGIYVILFEAVNRNNAVVDVIKKVVVVARKL